MARKRSSSNVKLTDKTQIKVRFSEVDSMHIVWHGEYVRYFEDGRESFGRTYKGLGYMDIYENGYTAPLVDLKVQYKAPLKCNDTAIIETKYIDTEAAKICFEYVITRESDGAIVAIGSSMQVFVNKNNDLQLLSPDFYLKWKERWNIL